MKLVVLQCPPGTQDISIRNVLELANAHIIVWGYCTVRIHVIKGALLYDLGTPL